MRTFYIYLITNKINNKTYVGQKVLEKRYSSIEIDGYMSSGKLIKFAEKKYGIENFDKEILAICHSREIANILEKQYIKLYREIEKAEYNIGDGGLGNISEPWNKGKTGVFSEESLNKIRAARKNQVITQESIDKRKKSIDVYWESEKGKEMKEKLSEIQKGVANTKGKHWYNNGKENVVAFECPEGFVKGKLSDYRPTEEDKQKKRDWYKNNPEKAKECFRKSGESRRGKPLSEQAKKKIGEANSHHVWTEEEREKHRKAMTGKHWKTVDGKRVFY